MPKGIPLTANDLVKVEVLDKRTPGINSCKGCYFNGKEITTCKLNNHPNVDEIEETLGTCVKTVIGNYTDYIFKRKK